MFKHILIPTDGSELSEMAVSKGLAFAKSIGARIMILHVMPEFHQLPYYEGSAFMGEELEGKFKAEAQARADGYLAAAKKTADAAGVACDGLAVTHDQPYRAIIDAAQGRGCDLVLMASHGRRGLNGLLLGSETSKVLTHAKIPVLVYR